MRRWSLVIGVILSTCATAPVMGESLTVLNASFEDHVLSAGEYTFNGVGLDPWIPEAGEQVGVWNLSDFLDYPGGAPDGVNVAYSQGPSISQVLSAVVVEGMTYALTVEVGNSPCCAFLGYGVQLLAGGVVLAEDANSIPADPATFETVLVTYTSPPGDPNAGETLEIRLQALGPEVAFDHVRLTATDAAYPDWEQLDSGAGMSRQSASTVYDSARGVLVMFGGRDLDPLADTWEHDGATWSQVMTTTSPPGRFWHAMAYDSNREKVVLFGGGDPGNSLYYDDTWEYDGTDWQQINTANAPPPMVAKTMVFDSARNLTVLVGGDGPSNPYDDTWEYDGSNWTLVNTPQSPPPPSALAAMAYDAARDRTVLTFNEGAPLHLQTWEYDGTTWTEVVTATAPIARWAHTVAFDASSQRIVLFGGHAPNYGGGSSMDDTWEYDGSEWTQIVTPHSPWPTEQHTMAYDSAAGRVVITIWDETWGYTSPSLFLDGLESGDTSAWSQTVP